MLQSFGALDGDPEEVLDVYYRQCSLRVTSTDLAKIGATLARGGVNPQTGRRVTGASVVKRTLSVMVTCGMYDAAGDWVSAVGMPAKSGVGGGIVAVLPGQPGSAPTRRCSMRRGTASAEFACAAVCLRSSACIS